MHIYRAEKSAVFVRINAISVTLGAAVRQIPPLNVSFCTRKIQGKHLELFLNVILAHFGSWCRGVPPLESAVIDYSIHGDHKAIF